MRKRVVVTGIGLVTPIGIGVKDFTSNILKARSGIDVIKQFNPQFSPCKIAAEIKDFYPRKYFDEKTIKMNPRYSQFGLIASREAIKHAKLDNLNKERVGVIIGTSAAGITYSLEQQTIFLKKGFKAMDPFLVSVMNNGVGVRGIVIENGFKGISNTFTSTCVASADAIGYSYNLIREGKMDAMITGGAESCIHPSTIAGFYLGRILSKKMIPLKTPSPFDLDRDGTVLGEGAAILVLEEYSKAKKRKARILGEIIGYGSTSDAYHFVQPEPSGLQGARAIRLALKDANINPRDVNYINAHGTGTKRNDWFETCVIKNVFGKHAYKIPVSSTKSMTGHLLGASGALEIIICILAIKNKIIPPTINYHTVDPQCDLDYVPNELRKSQIKVAISNSFGFGGHNSVLIVREHE